MKYLITVIALLVIPVSSQAEKNSPEILKQQLQSLQNDLEQAAKTRQQQHRRVEKLNQQLKCNLELIRAYDDCDTRHKDNPTERLRCTQKAKASAAACLNTSSTEQ